MSDFSSTTDDHAHARQAGSLLLLAELEPGPERPTEAVGDGLERQLSQSASGGPDDVFLAAALSLDTAAKTFSMLAYDGGKLYVNNFALPVIVDLQGMAQREQVKALLHHNPATPAGHMTAVEIGQRAVRLQGVVSVPAALEYLQAAQQQGFRWEASIGATIDRSALEELRAGQSVLVNGRKQSGPALIARKSILNESSFTGLGAGFNTSANLSASLKAKETTMSKGAATQTSTDQQSTAAGGAELQACGQHNTPLTADSIKLVIREVIGTEVQAAMKPLQSELDRLKQERVTGQVEDLAASMGVSDKTLIQDLQGKVGEGKLSIEGAELALLRASGSQKTAGFEAWVGGNKTDGPSTPAVLEAAYMINTGWTDKELADHGDFDEKTINAALAIHGLGPHALMVEALRTRGHHVIGGKLQSDDIHAAMHYAEQDRLQASGGVSTISLPGILSNVARKEMLRGRNSVSSAIRKIAKRATASDYKPFYMYRLNTDGLLQQVGPDGELKSMELKEDAYTSRVYPWGRKLQITEVMFRNDDAGAFSDLARLFGRMSQITEEKEGCTKLLSDQSNFWTTGKGNRLASGGTSALSLDALKSAYALFLKFTDGTTDDNPISVEPRLLLTGPTDHVLARTLNTSSTINVATGSDLTIREGVDNMFRGMFEPIWSPYLVSGRVTNATNTQWLLCADPAETAPIVVAYLNGRGTPQIQRWEQIPGKLGMQWDISHRFGFNLHDDKASVYSPGA